MCPRRNGCPRSPWTPPASAPFLFLLYGGVVHPGDVAPLFFLNFFKLALMLIPPIMLAHFRRRGRNLAPIGAASFSAASFQGRVVSVPDGDGFALDVSGRLVGIRLWGCDAPEWGQPYARQAWQLLTRLTAGAVITCSVMDRDRYGRLVCDCVAADLPPLSLLMTLNGLAWYSRRYAPDASHIRGAERLARLYRRGLWKDQAPVPPWHFRLQSHSRRSFSHG